MAIMTHQYGFDQEHGRCLPNVSQRRLAQLQKVVS